MTIQLTSGPDVLRLEVSDNGRGLGLEKSAAESGLAITGMRERALAAGGRIELGDADGGGTTVIVEVPNG